MEEAKRIVELYTPQAYAIALRLTGNRSEAWDLVQNAMVKVLKNFDQYDPSYKIEQWLYGILRNLYIDRLRLEARRKEDPLELGADDERLSHADRVADREPGPEKLLERESEREAVQAALNGLPPDLRMALILVDIEGFSYEDAAGILELPSSTLGVRVFRGRKLLKEKLSSYMEA